MRWTYSVSIPETLYVACSGGVDSVATAAILSNWRSVTLLHFSHDDHAAEQELHHVEQLARQLSVSLITNKQATATVRNREAQWRDARYQWFHSLNQPVATGHTLDDAEEWYWMTCMRGSGEYMQVRNRNVFRPFLLTSKQSLVDYCVNAGLSWWEDPTNQDTDFALRNKVRATLMPSVLECNPHMSSVVKRRLIKKIIEQKNS